MWYFKLLGKHRVEEFAVPFHPKSEDGVDLKSLTKAGAFSWVSQSTAIKSYKPSVMPEALPDLKKSRRETKSFVLQQNNFYSLILLI